MGKLTGLDLLEQWLEITKQAFNQKIKEAHTVDDAAPNILSRDTLERFQKEGLPIIRDALDLLDTSRDLDLVKVRNGDLTISDAEKEKYEAEQDFCQFMLRGADD